MIRNQLLLFWTDTIMLYVRLSSHFNEYFTHWPFYIYGSIVPKLVYWISLSFLNYVLCSHLIQTEKINEL